MLQKQEQAARRYQQLEDMVRQRMTRDAYSRYGNIKAADPELAARVLLSAAQYIDKMKVKMLTDDDFKRLLAGIMPRRRDFQIRRR